MASEKKPRKGTHSRRPFFGDKPLIVTAEGASFDPPEDLTMAPHLDKIFESYQMYHAKNHFLERTNEEEWKDEMAKCHHCQLRAFSTEEKYPVCIRGTRDISLYFKKSVERGSKGNPVLPRDFTFIQESILGAGVERAQPEFRSGCECDDDEDCLVKGCSCLEDMDNAVEGAGGKIYSYNYNPYTGDELLRDHFLESRAPIYECHSGCACSANCRNRVVERGRQIPLHIFRTEDGRGWGVQTNVPIKRGTFIDKYVGEIITAEEADRRRKASAVVQRKDIYLFALDKFTDPESNDPRLRGPPLEVDGEYFGGPTCFINHSCDPNLRIFARVGDYADKHIHDLAFFAIRDIPANTELTFDYTDGYEEDVPAVDRHLMTECLCKGEGCRGHLW